MSRPCVSERAYAKGVWLMGPEGEYLRRYWTISQAQRAARDFNRTGRALSPDEYARTRR